MNPSVMQMLKRPIQKPASSNSVSPGASSVESVAELVASLHASIATRDAQIAALQQTIERLTISGSSRKAVPEFNFEVTGHDKNGRIRYVKATPT